MKKKPADFSVENDELLLWLAWRCPAITKKFDMLCNALVVRATGKCVLLDPDHRKYAREYLRRLPERPNRMKKFDESYDPFASYLLPLTDETRDLIERYSLRSTMAPGSKSGSSRSPIRNTGKNKSPARGTLNMKGLGDALDDIATTSLRIVKHIEDYDSRYDLPEGYGLTCGNLNTCIFESKLNANQEMVY